MSETVFTGKFQKPTETFSVQHLDGTDLNRVSEDVLFWIVVAAAAGLALHFLVSTLPGLLRKSSMPAESQGGSDLQLKRRDAAQVAYHWINAAAIVALTVSGLAIFFGMSGTDGLFQWHLWAAWALIGGLVFHIWYDAILHKNFHRMWASRDDVGDAIQRVTGGSGRPPPKHGFYKVEQIAFHWMLAAVVLGVVVSGFILWNPGRMFVGPFWLPWGWDAVFIARVVHQVLTFVLIAMVLAHVYFAMLVPKEWPRLKSIFTGRVRFSWYAKEHKVSPQLEAQARTAATSAGRATPLPGNEQAQKG